jgi:hypothetical protein
MTAVLAALLLGATHLLGAPPAEHRHAPQTGAANHRSPAAARRGCAVSHRRTGRVRARCARIRARRTRTRRETLADVRLRSLPGGGTSTPPGSTTPPAPDPPAAPQRNVSVTAKEFSLLLSRPVVDHGRVGIQLRNAGEDPHNLQIAREDTPLAVLLGFPTLAPGENDRRFEDLAPGRYVLWCSLEGHEALGMHTTLDVR